MSADPSYASVFITVAERLLTDVWAGEVRLGAAEMLQSDKSYRLVVTEAPAGTPTSVVVKRAQAEPGLPLNPDATEGNPAQPLLEEWAGLAFLNSVLPDKSLVPTFYAGDRSACMLVLEDLGKHPSLIDALQGSDPEYARECLTLHAQAVAELHAHTLGQAAEAGYWQIRDALGPRGVPRDWKTYGNLLATQG